MDLKLNICLSDIDKSKIKVSEKNGKKYLTIYCNEFRNGVDQYGNTHTLTLGKDAEGNTIYVGKAKPSEQSKNENVPF